MRVRAISIVPIMIALGALLTFPTVLGNYSLSLVVQILIYAIFAMSLDLLVGYTGLPSLGHASFFGIGAYMTAILSTRYGANFWICLLSSVAMASIVGVIFASIALRARGVYFLMITMALTMVVWGLANRWVALTNGDSGISGIPAPDLGTLGSFDGRDRFYFLILVVFVSVFILFNSIVRSPFGKSLEGIRENEVRMESLGYNVWLHKFIVFVIAAALAGVAGTLWCYYNNFVSPVDTSFINSVEVFLMVALGGPGTIIGAVLGSALLVLIKNIVALYTQHWLLVVGCIYILLVLLRPGGLMRASQSRGLVRHSTAY